MLRSLANFSEFAKVFTKVSREFIHIQLVKGYRPLPPWAPAGEGHRRISVWSRFSSQCGAVLRTFTFPFIAGGRASKGEALPQPDPWSTSLLALPNIAFWSLKKQTPHAAVKLPKVRLCQSQTPRPLVFAFPLLRSLGVFLWKFRESFAEERAKVKVHFEGVGPVSLAKTYAWGPNQQPSALKSDSVMLSATFIRLSRSDPWQFGVI